MSFRRCDWLFPPSAREVSPGNRSNYKSTRERVDSKGLYGRWRLHLMGSCMGPITTCPNFPFEENKYGLHYVHVYLENFVDSAKRSIVGVIKALADDEKLDSFYKYLMFTHLYSPEEIAKIDREELSREEESILKGD